MKNSPPLNGSDQLMRGFDFESRRHGFAGNHCQIILELNGKISSDILTKRVAELINHFPILRSRPSGCFRPRWKRIGHTVVGPQIRTHRDAPDLRQKLFNEPLRVSWGELMRFDLVERDGAKMDFIFTWTH